MESKNAGWSSKSERKSHEVCIVLGILIFAIVLLTTSTAPRAQQASVAPTALTKGGHYVGRYTCAQGETQSTLEVHPFGIFATVYFGTSGAQAGVFLASIEATNDGSVRLSPMQWVTRPDGYVMGPMIGKVSGDRFSGSVQLASCGAFEYVLDRIATASSASALVAKAASPVQEDRASLSSSRVAGREEPNPKLREPSEQKPDPNQGPTSGRTSPLSDEVPFNFDMSPAQILSSKDAIGPMVRASKRYSAMSSVWERSIPSHMAGHTVHSLVRLAAEKVKLHKDTPLPLQGQLAFLQGLIASNFLQRDDEEVGNVYAHFQTCVRYVKYRECALLFQVWFARLSPNRITEVWPRELVDRTPTRSPSVGGDIAASIGAVAEYLKLYGRQITFTSSDQACLKESVQEKRFYRDIGELVGMGPTGGECELEDWAVPNRCLRFKQLPPEYISTRVVVNQCDRPIVYSYKCTLKDQSVKTVRKRVDNRAFIAESFEQATFGEGICSFEPSFIYVGDTPAREYAN